MRIFLDNRYLGSCNVIILNVNYIILPRTLFGCLYYVIYIRLDFKIATLIRPFHILTFEEFYLY